MMTVVAKTTSHRLLIEIRAKDFPGSTLGPGKSNVHVGLQGRGDVTGLVNGDAVSATWTVECNLTVPDFDVRGPDISGRVGERFIYLSWGSVDASGHFAMFGRTKLMLDSVDPSVLTAASQDGNKLVGSLGLTTQDGRPVYAAVRPPAINWTISGVHRRTSRSPERG